MVVSYCKVENFIRKDQDIDAFYSSSVSGAMMMCNKAKQKILMKYYKNMFLLFTLYLSVTQALAFYTSFSIKNMLWKLSTSLAP